MCQQNAVDSLKYKLTFLNDDSSKLKLLDEIGILYYRLNETDSALHYGYKERHLATSIHNSEAKVNANKILAYSYRKKSFYSLAVQHAQEVLNANAETGDIATDIRMLNFIGLIYKDRANYLSALEKFSEALALAEKSNDTLRQINILNNIGLTNYRLGKYDVAEKYYKLTFDLAKKFNSLHGKDLYFHNFGLLLMERGKYTESLEHLNKAQEIALQNGDLNNIAVCYSDKGEVYTKMGKYSLALQQYDSAYSIREKRGNLLGMATVFLNIGNINLLRGNYNNAISNYGKGIEISDQIKSIILLPDLYLKMSEAYEKLGQYNQSLDLYKKYKFITDSIFSIENNRHIVEWETKYQTTQKEKELEFLREQERKNTAIIAEQKALQKNQLLTILIIVIALISLLAILILQYLRIKQKRKNAQLLEEQNQEITAINQQIEIKNKELAELNKTKDKLFSIIAHDIKAPFTGLMGSLEIIEDSFDSLSEEEKKQFIHIASRNCQNIFEFVNNLLAWSGANTKQLEPYPTTFSLSKIINNTILILKDSAFNKGIRLHVGIKDDELVYADEMMLETVIRNLISNAIKFTPRNGDIKIESAKNNQKTEIYIRDTGVGIPPEKLNKIFNIGENSSTPGTEKEEGTGLGLPLCNEFIELQKGKIEVESEPGKGSKFTVYLPAKKQSENINT